MGTKFTPGPWACCALVDEFMAFTIQRDDARPIPIADTYNASAMSVPAAEAEANARLIAAAPELYEAVEAAKFWIGMQDRQSPELGLLIDRALAKARGDA